MDDLEEAGWTKAKKKAVKEITQTDVKSIFKLVDVDKSGVISRNVSQYKKYRIRETQEGTLREQMPTSKLDGVGPDL